MSTRIMELMCVCQGERLYFTHTLPVFSRLLVYLTFSFCLPRHPTKRKGDGGSIFFDFFFFSKLPEYFIQNDGRSPFRAKGGDGEGGIRYASSPMAIMTRTNALSSSNCYLLDPLIRLLLLHLRSLGIRFCIRACVM